MAELNMLGHAHRRIDQLLAELRAREEENAAALAENRHLKEWYAQKCMQVQAGRATITALREGLERIKPHLESAYSNQANRVINEVIEIGCIVNTLLYSTSLEPQADKLADPEAAGDAVACAARAAFEAYVPIAFKGYELPKWEFLPENLKEGWHKAVLAAHPNSKKPDSKAVDQSREIKRLREAVAWCYQLAGAINEPVYVLDNLSALANGEAAPHEWQAAGCKMLEQNQRLAEKARSLDIVNEIICKSNCELTNENQRLTKELEAAREVIASWQRTKAAEVSRGEAGKL